MGALSDLLGLDNATQSSDSTAQGWGSSTHQTVEQAKESCYRQDRFVESTTGYYGTGKEIMDQARKNGMGASQLKELEKNVLRQSF